MGGKKAAQKEPRKLLKVRGAKCSRSMQMQFPPNDLAGERNSVNRLRAVEQARGRPT
jgi:hypothetical protein